MLDSHYILVFIDMFLGCVVGYLAAPYVNDGLEKLYKKLKKNSYDFTDITPGEAKTLLAESISEDVNSCIAEIKDKIVNKKFEISDQTTYVVGVAENRDIAKGVEEYFKLLGYPVLLVGTARAFKCWVYVFVEGDVNDLKPCEYN